MSIVGIDPSLTSTGIAVLALHPVGSTKVMAVAAVGRDGTAGEGYPERARRIVAQTRRVISQIPADTELMVMEGPSYGSQYGAQMDRHALWMGVYSTIQGRGVPIAVVAPGTREKWATGSVPRGIDRKVRKARVLAAVREMFPGERIRNDDEGDALILAAMGAHHLGWPMPFETKERHTTGLQAIDWPTELRATP